MCKEKLSILIINVIRKEDRIKREGESRLGKLGYLVNIDIENSM